MAAVAFVYSLWAIAGSGAETAYWGFILLIAGLPVYVMTTRRARVTPAPVPSGG